MNEPFEPLDADEVLYVPVGRVLMRNPTFKVGEFLDALAQAVSDLEEDWPEEKEGWFGGLGLNCEALRFSSGGWQRGRVRIRLEFSPDFSEPKALQGRREDVRKPEPPLRLEDEPPYRPGRSNRYEPPYEPPYDAPPPDDY